MQGASRAPPADDRKHRLRRAAREEIFQPVNPTDPLSPYRARRSPERTPEPFGGEGTPSAAGLFCVQKHAATRTHYDLRLQWGGVLKSWAVPKGPSLDPTEKRLAVQVEDHPLEYADFEGVIPAGEYGAGPVILWDTGRWIPREDPEEGLARGKLLFDLQGYKLRGTWTLVRLQKGETGNEWLLIRERRGTAAARPTRRTDGPGRPDASGGPDADTGDEGAGPSGLPDASVLSGLTVEQLDDWTAGRLEPAASILQALEHLEPEGARRRPVFPPDVELMLARTRDQPFSDPAWIFELKMDGYRMLAARDGNSPLILTRGGNDATSSFPEIARTLAALPFGDLVLDGEVVVHDESGLPSFQRLQRRARLTRLPDVQHEALERPASFYAFDLLAFQEWDLRPLPLRRRKEVLRMVLPPAGPFRYLDHFEGAGEALYEHVAGLGLEGIVAKRAASSYRGGRRDDWLKIHVPREGLFAIAGFTEPGGRRRQGLGALHLAVCADDEPEKLVYAGRVGTGFSERDLAGLRERLEPLRRKAPPCEGPVPRGREHIWTEPRLVCAVRYKEWTDQGLLRAPVFLGLREAPLEDCRRTARAPRAEEPARVEGGPPAPEELPLTNLDKPFWPEEGHTKGDLLAYYRTVAPWLLPYLRERPLVLTRFPDGIQGTSFFQKDAPGYVPDWIRTVQIWSEGSEREISYFVAEDEASLLYLVNLGTIPFHVWSSRVRSLDHPDWCVLDLDPKEAPFPDVVAVARALRKLSREIGLSSFVKTSGSTGLHVLIPLDGTLGHEECRSLGELLARLVVAELPEISTVVRPPEKREGKVYVDYLQNGRGRLIVAPYSVRPLPGAPVSAPLRWREVKPDLDIGRFTIRSMPRRLRAMDRDPLLPVLAGNQDLLGALERLHTRLRGS